MVSDFFGETNMKYSFKHQDGLTKKPKKNWISKEAIVTAGGSRLISQTKNHL